MKKRVLIPTLIVGALLTGSLAMAGPGKCGSNCSSGWGGKGQEAMSYEQHEERTEHRLEKMGVILDLTEEQKSQFETMLNQQWQEKKQLREQMRASKDEMREARVVTDFNEVDFRSKAAKQAELKTEMMVTHAKMKQQVYALLTPEQQEKADTLSKMTGGRDKGHHGGRGLGF